jgi:hypothetical protein
MYGEGVSELVGSRAEPPAQRLHAELPQQLPNALRRRPDGERRSVEPKEQHLSVIRPTLPNQLLPKGGVAAKLGYEIGADGDNA